MSEKTDETNTPFKTLNNQSVENLQEEETVEIIKRKKLLISFSSNINDTNYSIENEESDSININSNNITNLASSVVDDISGSREEPKVLPESENPNILLRGHLNCTLSGLQLSPFVSKLPDEPLSPGPSEKSPVSNCSRNSYAQALKSNSPSKSTSIFNMEMNHNLKNIKEENNKFIEEIHYPIGEYENPFGVIGRNGDDKKEPKKLSEFRSDFSRETHEEKLFKTEVQRMIYEEVKELSKHENCFWKEFPNENNIWQENSHKTDTLNAVKFDNSFTKTTDSQWMGPLLKLSDGNKTYIAPYIKSTNDLLEMLDFGYPLNINRNVDSSDETCIEALRKDILSSNKDTKTGSSPEHNSYTSQVQVIPIEHVEDLLSISPRPHSTTVSISPIFLSKTLDVCGKKFRNEDPVLISPLEGGLDQDAEAQETNLMASPTHIAIESELCELWKDKSQKFFDIESKNALPPKSQQPGYEEKPIIQPATEDHQLYNEMQLFLNGCGQVKTSSMSDSSTVIKSCSSPIIMTEKGFNYTNVTNPPREHVGDACVQKIYDRLPVTTNNLASILNETSNVLVDFDSSYDFYRSVRNEIHKEIEEINQRISKLSDVL